MAERKYSFLNDWFASVVSGSQCTLESGALGTVEAPSGHPETSFSGGSTVILGAASSDAMEHLSWTTASWNIPLKATAIRCFEKGFLVVGCLRYFGGLHSATFNARAEVYLNNKAVDGFGLRKKPPNHSDYFHRFPKPKFPNLSPFSECRTIYAWPVLSDKLDIASSQVLAIKIGKYVRWDIDYVGMIVKMKKKHNVFLSHNWNDKPVARRLASDLEAKGISVWIDEAEIRLGDSLIAKIRDGIDLVDYLVVLLSRSSVASEWVAKEVDIAMNQEIEGKRVKVVPVLLHDVELPGFLKGKLYADLRSMDNYQHVISQIEQRVNS